VSIAILFSGLVNNYVFGGAGDFSGDPNGSPDKYTHGENTHNRGEDSPQKGGDGALRFHAE